MELDKKMNRLNEISEMLDKDGITVEKGMELFEEGAKLTKECLALLNETKGKITVIKKDIDATIEEDFN